MYPMLILLGIANGFTAGVRQRMMKCAALLGSYEVAVQMLADGGIKICVNTLRKVTAGMGEMLSRLTKLGSVKVSEDAAGPRIVVTTDGTRVPLLLLRPQLFLHRVTLSIRLTIFPAQEPVRDTSAVLDRQQPGQAAACLAPPWRDVRNSSGILDQGVDGIFPRQR